MDYKTIFLYLSIYGHFILDSEQSNECIYFTMMCFFKFFNFSIFSGGNVNIVDALKRLTFKIPNSFQKHLEKQKHFFDKINFGIWCNS